MRHHSLFSTDNVCMFTIWSNRTFSIELGTVNAPVCTEELSSFHYCLFLQNYAFNFVVAHNEHRTMYVLLCLQDKPNLGSLWNYIATGSSHNGDSNEINDIMVLSKFCWQIQLDRISQVTTDCLRWEMRPIRLSVAMAASSPLLKLPHSNSIRCLQFDSRQTISTGCQLACPKFANHLRLVALSCHTLKLTCISHSTATQTVTISLLTIDLLISKLRSS